MPRPPAAGAQAVTLSGSWRPTGAIRRKRATWEKRRGSQAGKRAGALPLCRIPVRRINAPIPCPRCHVMATQPNEAGIPDLIGWVPSGLLVGGGSWARPLFIEVKRPRGGRREKEQEAFIAEAKASGAIAIFARGWDECADQLRAEGVVLPKGM